MEHRGERQEWGPCIGIQVVHFFVDLLYGCTKSHKIRECGLLSKLLVTGRKWGSSKAQNLMEIVC